MSISVIGSGPIESVLTRRFAASGIDVSITNSRGASSLRALVQELGPHVRAVDLPEALEVDAIILTVLHATVPELAGEIDWAGRTVIDATNAINFSDFSPADLDGRLASDIIAETLPGTRAVKAFSTLPTALLENPTEAGGRRVILYLVTMRQHANRSPTSLSNFATRQSILVQSRKAVGCNSLAKICRA
ncbi:NAD(P)-binding domain-containing protein [Agrobacterium rhizogenes]|uniref:NADPH-dependent F420 reductase n=1 Tax=Rhizobium rhizogenes TaxID=359 RepID=UPI0022B6EA8A|nr:NAD(P)-binding domain-containing protein [Rhizobium rhizogenes]MCZ7449294.1 NAD(P)-binding domain-containing protein [Rhizobium rhizogenes]